MTAKKGIKLLTEILNIEGIKVISQRQHEGIGIVLQIEPIGKESVCPRYGTKSHRVHQCDLSKDKLTLDHPLPKSRGGSDSLENLRLACCPCNKSRGNNFYPPPFMRKSNYF